MSAIFDIRACVRADLAAVLDIYNEVIRNSTAVFSDEPVTLENRESWLASKSAAGHPALVACDHSGVLGFATYGDFRTWPGYRYTVEHSVHVAAGHRGRGIGGALIVRLIEHAAASGKHAMIAGIDAANAGSLRLHARLGFQEAGTLHEVAFKFGRWLDLKFLERLI